MNHTIALSQVVVSLLLLFFIWHFLFAKLRRDALQQAIRKSRNELFDYVWQNGHTYTKTVTEQIESLERFEAVSRRINLPILCDVLVCACDDTEEMKRKSTQLEQLPADLKDAISSSYRQAGSALLNYTFLRTATGMLVLASMVLFYLLVRTGQSITEAYTKISKRMEGVDIRMFANHVFSAKPH